MSLRGSNLFRMAIVSVVSVAVGIGVGYLLPHEGGRGPAGQDAGQGSSLSEDVDGMLASLARDQGTMSAQDWGEHPVAIDMQLRLEEYWASPRIRDEDMHVARYLALRAALLAGSRSQVTEALSLCLHDPWAVGPLTLVGSDFPQRRFGLKIILDDLYGKDPDGLAFLFRVAAAVDVSDIGNGGLVDRAIAFMETAPDENVQISAAFALACSEMSPPETQERGIRKLEHAAQEGNAVAKQMLVGLKGGEWMGTGR